MLDTGWVALVRDTLSPFSTSLPPQPNAPATARPPKQTGPPLTSQVSACSWSGESGLGSVRIAVSRQRLNSSLSLYTRQLGNLVGWAVGGWEQSIEGGRSDSRWVKTPKSPLESWLYVREAG
jgi:hypothetical protein